MAAEVRPVRTCVGCRAKAASSDLIRVVAVDGTLVPDVRRILPGRGAHVHPSASCIEAADRRRAWARALRITGPVDGSVIGEFGRRRETKALP